MSTPSSPADHEPDHRPDSRPQLTQRRIIASVLAVVALLAVLAFTWWIDGRGGPDDASATSASAAASTAPLVQPDIAAQSSAPKPGPRSTTSRNAQAADAPERVTKTLALIDAGRWPEAANAPGTHGGDVFRNNERRLPVKDASGKRMQYREWDVNGKKRGRGRDAERIITASDGSAWYTLDHYSTFTKIRGPSS